MKSDTGNWDGDVLLLPFYWASEEQQKIEIQIATWVSYESEKCGKLYRKSSEVEVEMEQKTVDSFPKAQKQWAELDTKDFLWSS
jgi:hypothetical protein